jgi:hypothetical protein
MQTFKQVLTWLSGKKSAIAASIGLIIAYLATKAIIGDEEVILFGGLNIIIFGGASYATSKLIYKK